MAAELARLERGDVPGKAEARSGGYPRGGDPGCNGAHRTGVRIPTARNSNLTAFYFLIAVAAPEHDGQPVGGFTSILQI